LELIDHVSSIIEKGHFIGVYNEVKAKVHGKRLERKKQQKIRLAGAEGALIKERKRERKRDKKREQKRDNRLQLELRKK
jgi:hypothetical protein